MHRRCFAFHGGGLLWLLRKHRCGDKKFQSRYYSLRVLVITNCIRKFIRILGIRWEKMSQLYTYPSYRIYQAVLKLLVFKMGNQFCNNIIPKSVFNLLMDAFSSIYGCLFVVSCNIDKHPIESFCIAHTKLLE